MNRRNFIRKTALAGAGAFVAPYILPSGRLYAATGARLANHVVFCLFAGGVRNLESVHKADGNLMPHTLTGSESISSDIVGGLDPVNPLGSQPLQNFGTLFKEFRYKQGPTGHYNGHTTAITGTYTQNDLNIKQPPLYPTVFEYYRKHNSPTNNALNAWWISDALGPYPFLNYSIDTNYGAQYGANYVQPGTFISGATYNVLANPKDFSGSEKTTADNLRKLFDGNFGNQYTPGDAGVENDGSDTALLETFINNEFTNAASGMYNDPWGQGYMNGDMTNVFFAERVIQEFQPELLVVNMQNVDICHSNFTQYCNNLRKADYALAHLWETIQSTPGMANDTVLIAVPEHGRNLSENTLVDQYGRFALDHTGEEMSREIFCLVAGPAGVVKQNQTINQVSGESIDVVPTIANILGFYDDIPLGYRNRMGVMLTQAFN